MIHVTTEATAAGIYKFFGPPTADPPQPSSRSGHGRFPVLARMRHAGGPLSPIALGDRTDDCNVPGSPAGCYADSMLRAASRLSTVYQRAVTAQPVSASGQRQAEPAVVADGHGKTSTGRIDGH